MRAGWRQFLSACSELILPACLCSATCSPLCCLPAKQPFARFKRPTLIQATAVVDRWGVGDIGHRNGMLTGAITVVSAFAPWVGAVLAAVLGSYDATFALLAGMAAASLLLLGRYRA